MKYEINITESDNTTNAIFKEVQEAFYNIPFENSTFQTETFVLGAEITPERAYRAIGLRIMSKLTALQEFKYEYLRTQIDLDETEFKLKNGELNQFDIRREKLKLEEINASSYIKNKLINDALVDLQLLYKHFKALPKYTREQFEASEKQHFEQKLLRQVLQLDGAKGALININEDLTALLEYEEKVAAMSSITNADLDLLSLSLPNMIKKA